MAFDRSAINTGRIIQDFGLCDLKGVYRQTSRLRGKGFLVVAFLTDSDPDGGSVATALQEWTEMSDKVSAVAVVTGERPDIEQWAARVGVTYPVLWDFEAYTAMLWAVSATPAVFIANSLGRVIGRTIDSDKTTLDAAKNVLAAEIQKVEAAAKAEAEAKAAA